MNIILIALLILAACAIAGLIWVATRQVVPFPDDEELTPIYSLIKDIDTFYDLYQTLKTVGWRLLYCVEDSHLTLTRVSDEKDFLDYQFETYEAGISLLKLFFKENGL